MLVAPTAIIWGEKVFVKLGAFRTSSVSVAVPLLPSDDVRSPDVFTNVPDLKTLWTSTLTEQVAPGATVPPVKVMLVPNVGALSVPPQVVAAFGDSAIETSVPRLSVKLRPLAPTVFAVLLIVKVSRLLSNKPRAIIFGANDLLNPGGADAVPVTIKVSVAVPLLPAEDVRSPVVLTYVAGVVLVTATKTSQFIEAATVPPVYAMTLDPAVAVAVPPQLSKVTPAASTWIPAGKVSVKSRPVAGTVLAALLMPKTKLVVSPAAIGLSTKNFTKVGGVCPSARPGTQAIHIRSAAIATRFGDIGIGSRSPLGGRDVKGR